MERAISNARERLAMRESEISNAGSGSGSGSGSIAIDDPIIQGRSRLYEVSRSVRLRVALLLHLQYLLQLALVTSNAAPL